MQLLPPPPLAGGWGGREVFYFIYLLIFWPRLTACGTLVPQPGIKPLHPAEALEAQTLNPWTTRVVPSALLDIKVANILDLDAMHTKDISSTLFDTDSPAVLEKWILSNAK